MTPQDAAELPLVGRAGELEEVEARLGAGGCVAVAGPLGIGKSRLLAELAARADARGHVVLAGRGSEYEVGVPYGVAVDTLEDYLASLGPGEHAALAPELAPVFPALVPAAPRPAATFDAERFHTHRALRSLLERLARRRPLTLTLDDLHWADAETVELVAHLLRHPPRGRVLLAIAYRPAHVSPVLGDALAQARRDGRCSLLEPAPLTPEQAGSLLAGIVPAAVRGSIIRESAGNPFFLEQLVRGGATAAAGDAAAGDGDVPPAVLAALQRELAAASATARGLLSGGAVAGEPFEIDLAALAAELDEADALCALDELLEADLLRATDVPRRFAFRHPLVRRAVYQAAGAGWRLGAHARLAAALRARHAPLTAQAEHVERSSAPGDEEAFATLAGAGHAIASTAPATAARWLAAALDLLPAGDGDRRLEVQVPLAAALASAGRLEDARATLVDAVEALGPGQVALRARAATFIARIDHALGRQGEARSLLERTLAELPDPRSPSAAALHLELVMDDLFTVRHAEMRARAARALELAQELGDPLLEAASWAGVAHAAQSLGDIPASIEAARRGGAIVDGLDDARCAPLLEAFWWLASAEDVLEHWDAGNAHIDRGLRLARAYGVSFVFVALTHTRAVTLGWQGALARARDAAEETVDAAHLAGNQSSIAYAYTAQCFVHAQAGEGVEAVRAGERAVAAARALPPGLFVALPHANLGAALLEAGEPERARAQLLEARARGALEHWVGRCWWELWMCEAELALGRLDEADRCARDAAATAERMGLPGRRGAVRHAEAAVALARGDAAAAAGAAGEAAELLAGAGRPVASARARILAGRALAATGRRDAALATLERARGALLEAGAPRLADAAARELRKLGVRVSRAGTPGGAVDGVGALSARERQIAERVAAGRTNREIAAELHLSESTVENHLSRVFRKLGISSRAVLAGAIARRA